MSVATFRGSISDVEAPVAVADADDGSLRLSGSARVRSISIVSPPEFRNHVLGADFLDAARHPVIVSAAELEADEAIERAVNWQLSGRAEP